MRKSKSMWSRLHAWMGGLVVGAMVVLLAACAGPASTTGGAAVTAEVGASAAITLAQASLLYLRRCSVCHGERGDGRSLASTALSQVPRDFTTESTRQTMTREYMIAIVRDGRPGKPMVGRAVQLSQAQIEAIVDFVRVAFIPPDPTTAAGQGWSLYRPLCASCHGDRGEGGGARRGIRRAPEVSLSRPGSTLTEARFLAVMTADSHVTAMEGRKLGDAERQAVSAYVRQAFVEQLGLPPGAARPATEAAGH